MIMPPLPPGESMVSATVEARGPTPVYLYACRSVGCKEAVYFYREADDAIPQLEVRHGSPPTEAVRVFQEPEVVWRWENLAIHQKAVFSLKPVTDWIATVHAYERGE